MEQSPGKSSVGSFALRAHFASFAASKPEQSHIQSQEQASQGSSWHAGAVQDPYEGEDRLAPATPPPDGSLPPASPFESPAKTEVACSGQPEGPLKPHEKVAITNYAAAHNLDPLAAQLETVAKSSDFSSPAFKHVCVFVSTWM